MQIQDWSEEGFIGHMLEQFKAPEDVVGIGDDCAVIPISESDAWLITTDTLVEGVHFLKEQISPTDLGYKSIAVNVSDIAAMGGMPNYAFLTLAVPKDLDRDWLEQMSLGIKEACQKWNIDLLGGDTVCSKRDIFLSVTLIGRTSSQYVKYRNTAQVGDILCVSGYLGESGGGLKVLQENVSKDFVKSLVEAHFRPTPDPKLGAWLASQKEVHAMMDISDGLNRDLTRLLEASKCGAVVETTHLPISEELKQVCELRGWDPLEIALTGGEDYCLLLTIEEESFTQKFKEILYPIGHITDQVGKIDYLKEGTSLQLKLKDFKHF